MSAVDRLRAQLDRHTPIEPRHVCLTVEDAADLVAEIEALRKQRRGES